MNQTRNGKQTGCFSSGCISILITTLILIVLAGFLLLFSVQILNGIGSYIIYSDPLQKADAIAVLSGGGGPRLKEAAKLFEENKGAYIILTQTGIVTDKFGELSQIEKTDLTEMGVQPKAIIITEAQVDTTIDEASAIRKVLSVNGFKSVIVVTDSFHTKRTHLIFEDAYKNSGIKVIIRPVRDDWYNSDTWWKTTEGWQVTLQEYSKLLGYFFEQQIVK